MDFLFEPLSFHKLESIEQFLSDWFFVLSIGFLAVELIRYAIQKRLSWSLAGDTVTNFVTQVLFFAVSIALFFTLYVSTLSYVHQFALFDVTTNGLTVIVCIVLADFAYYWEHRFSHRVALAWATHSVHHS